MRFYVEFRFKRAVEFLFERLLSVCRLGLLSSPFVELCWLIADLMRDYGLEAVSISFMGSWCIYAPSSLI